MYIGMNLALILALALAAIGSSTKHQADVRNSSTGVRGQNLNHNETLVRDTAQSPPANGSTLRLNSDQSFVSQLFISFYRPGAGCAPWVRGHNLNHNETLVRDATLSQPVDGRSSRRAGEQSFAARLLTLFSFYRPGAGCSKWVCGTNHNETLFRDTTLSQPANDWSRWLSEKLLASPLFISSYRPGAGCAHWHCNHNETLLRDAAPIK